MKRKHGHVVDLKAFLERVAVKKRQTENHGENEESCPLICKLSGLLSFCYFVSSKYSRCCHLIC